MGMGSDVNMTQRRFGLSLNVYYFFSGLLFFFYCFTLFKSFDPQVSLEYKLFYIERELIEWPGSGGLEYKLGQTLYFGSQDGKSVIKKLGGGWSDNEEAGCWMKGKRSTLYLTGIKADKDLILNLDVFAIHPKVSVAVSVNGVSVGRIDGNNQAGEEGFLYQFPILEETIKEGGFFKIVFEDESGTVYKDVDGRRMMIKKMVIK